MPTLIASPTVIQAAGNKPKRIEEYAGRVNSGHEAVSVARMVSPEGWVEPGQRPAFEEITVVLRGLLRVEHDGGVLDVRAGQAVVSLPGEWIRYSSSSRDSVASRCSMKYFSSRNSRAESSMARPERVTSAFRKSTVISPN